MVIKPLRFFYDGGRVPTTYVQTDGISATHRQTYGVSTTPVKYSWVSALRRMIDVIVISLWQSTFSSSVMWNISDIPAQRPYLRPIQTTFCHSGLGMINSLSFRTINPELHLPWEGKAQRVVKFIKGVISLIKYQLCFFKVRDLPFLSIHIFLYPCTLRIYFRTPVPQGFSLHAYFTTSTTDDKLMVKLVKYARNGNPWDTGVQKYGTGVQKDMNR